MRSDRTEANRSPLRLAALVVTGLTVGATLAFGLALSMQGQVLRSDLTFALLFAAVGGAAASLILFVLSCNGGQRWLWLALLPLLVFPLGLGALMVPAGSPVAQITLKDGRTIHLNIQSVPTDVVYDLWIDDGLIWRRVGAELDYSEDGRFIGDERLTLSDNGQRLFVGRGGIWTDCLEVMSNFETCNLGLERTWWGDPNFEAIMRRNSARMAAAMRDS